MLFAFIFPTISLTASSVSVNNVSALTSDEFCSLVREMITEYDLANDGYQTFSVSADNSFASCRLIVKSSNDINVSDAVSVISGYKNLWILQYDSEEEANAFLPPDWLGEDVTNSSKYHNSNLSKQV